jgi:molybdate transport system substrate-binding protein
MRINGISSMATRSVLAELAELYRTQWRTDVDIASVGGVDAAKRVQAGEAFDVVILASDAIDKLVAGGLCRPGQQVDLVRSGVAVAVRAGASRPDIASEDALRNAVRDARTLGYSTGPSGVQLAKLFERWGIADEIKSRIVTAPPGVPVGSLVAKGEVELGFQQLSELMHLEGIDVIGPLPARCRSSPRSRAACALRPPSRRPGATCSPSWRRPWRTRPSAVTAWSLHDAARQSPGEHCRGLARVVDERDFRRAHDVVVDRRPVTCDPPAVFANWRHLSGLRHPARASLHDRAVSQPASELTSR